MELWPAHSLGQRKHQSWLLTFVPPGPDHSQHSWLWGAIKAGYHHGYLYGPGIPDVSNRRLAHSNSDALMLNCHQMLTFSQWQENIRIFISKIRFAVFMCWHVGTWNMNLIKTQEMISRYAVLGCCRHQYSQCTLLDSKCYIPIQVVRVVN